MLRTVQYRDVSSRFFFRAGRRNPYVLREWKNEALERRGRELGDRARAGNREMRIVRPRPSGYIAYSPFAVHT
jgi:hypothetical protein